MTNHSIQVLRKGKDPQSVPLRAGLTIGRSPTSGIQIEDPMISRTHAEIQVEGETFVLRDRSANGTLLNRRRLPAGESAPLANNDRITFGNFDDCELVVQLVAKAAPPEPAPITVALPKAPTPQPLMQHLLSGKVPIWSKGPITVKVADIIDEATDVKTYRFVGVEPVIFSYKPGQFVTVMPEIAGKKVPRSYSLSSTPSRPHVLEITVKRVPGGLVSNWLADNLKLGDKMDVGSPGGKFTCFDYPSNKMLFIGAGSGVTPLMSMTRWVIDTTADVDIKFLLSARTPDDIIFHRELEYLSARHSGFQCAVTVTSRAAGADPWLGYSGRLCRQMLEILTPDLNDRHVFMCGPPAFSDAVRKVLEELRFPMANMHTESFVPGRVGPEAKGKVKVHDVRPGSSTIEKVQVERAPVAPPPQRAAAPAAPAEAAPAGQFKVHFLKSKINVVTTGEASLLELAENNGIEIDHQCRMGFCGMCKARCVSGDVQMQEEAGLELLGQEERDQRYILTCVGRPTANVELDV